MNLLGVKMRKRGVVLIDMDNTINRLWETFYLHYNNLHNKSVNIEREDLVHYQLSANIPDFDPLKDDELRQTIFSTPGFWESISVMDSDTIRVVQKLFEDFDTYICTTPWPYYSSCATEKIHWIQKHMPFIDIDRMIFIRKKSMIRADYIIEDAPENLVGPVTPIIVDFPYNRQCFGIRTKNWSDIERVMFE